MCVMFKWDKKQTMLPEFFGHAAQLLRNAAGPVVQLPEGVMLASLVESCTNCTRNKRIRVFMDG